MLVSVERLLSTIVIHNGYCDALLQMLLGSGMVVMLMEDAKREADDARAELAVAHDKLRRDALYDSLTDSLNRRAFAEGVGLEMARATFGAVVVLDMDNLKQVNDSAGHACGDELLQHLAGTLRVVASEMRSQGQNRERAVERFAELLRRALLVPKARRKTKPSRGSVEERLREKKKKSERKKDRRGGWD